MASHYHFSGNPPLGGMLTALLSGRARPTKAGFLSLRHPVLGQPDVPAWRALLAKQPLRQPIRQADLLTPPEATTDAYSSRFAAYIFRQHQFSSLTKLRGWRYSLLGAYNKGYDTKTATLKLPALGLRAEPWVSKASAPDSWNATGIFHYGSTNQVRFVRGLDEVGPRPEVPAMIFSEVVRDVDLLVGVASVSNDPQWRANGGLPQHRNYRKSYSFGELSKAAHTHHLVLKRLLPGLAGLAWLRRLACTGPWVYLSALLLTACEQSGIIDERRAYPPFTLYTTGRRDQALWGPRRETLRYTVAYQGKVLHFPDEARDAVSFDWCQPLPGGRLLLAIGGDTLAPGHGPAGFRFYQLRTAATGPCLDWLGPGCPLHVGITDQPALWLTPDSLFLLLPTPDSRGQLQNATYRLRDLRPPGAVLPVPPTPLTSDSTTLEIRRIEYAPQRQQLTRIYTLASTAEELLELIDLPSGRRRFYHYPDPALGPVSPADTVAGLPAASFIPHQPCKHHANP
jgi:hypothetical protein